MHELVIMQNNHPGDHQFPPDMGSLAVTLTPVAKRKGEKVNKMVLLLVQKLHWHQYFLLEKSKRAFTKGNVSKQDLAHIIIFNSRINIYGSNFRDVNNSMGYSFFI